jgi:hypothetical protein
MRSAFAGRLCKQQPLRTLDDVGADALALENEAEQLLNEIIETEGRQP